MQFKSKAQVHERRLFLMKLNVICNAEANARPQMLKRFFLSERKLLNAILRVKLKNMKDVSF